MNRVWSLIIDNENSRQIIHQYRIMMLSLTLSQVLFLLAWISSSTKAQSCGRLSTCDKLISHSIFTKGPCGRAARCWWELLHLEKALRGDNTNEVKYEGYISDMLCRIPTLKAYRTFAKKFFNPCGIQPGDNSSDRWHSEEFDFYPMPASFVLRDATGDKYLTRVESCTTSEDTCNLALHKAINDTCGKLDETFLEKLEEAFPMKVRGKPYYKLVYLHPELKTQTIDVDYKFPRNFSHEERRYFPNKCALFHIVRQRYDSSDTNGIPKYEDEHRPNSIYPRLRGPYFDLHLLYKADPEGKFQSIPEEDRWWNQTKAFQELAHFLPTDMLEDIHKAINCVYDRVDSNNMEWRPEKFCWGYNTFVCVEDAKVKRNDCGGALGTDQRHDDTSAALISNRPNP